MIPPARAAIHTMTTKPWTLEECVRAYERAGIGGISVWPESLGDLSVREAARLLEASSLEVVSLVRGGFFVHAHEDQRENAIARNRRLIEDAAALGAKMLVIVAGADPSVPLREAREQVLAGMERLLAHAESFHVRLALEPLHPMYAADRSCILTLREANFICDCLDHPLAGVAVDVYHTWWDSELEHQIALAGQRNRLFAFHVCDWRPPRDLLNDRALMGDGCIPIPTIRACMERAGFDGLVEVEIFSLEWWERDQNEFLARIIESLNQNV